ncbi:MAG: hypothetical protein LC774_08130 [Acidobacteria bacterium]|nr:hypothetical protein [Acidobacteriota bacterium]
MRVARGHTVSRRTPKRRAPTEQRELNDPSTKRAIVVVALRAALVAALLGAGWAVYRKLPQDDAGAALAGRASKQTLLRIVLRREGLGDAGVADTAVELYSLDVAAARREFDDERRYGQRFEDFVARRMGARQPVSAKLNREGQALVALPPGRWWVHAMLPGANELAWRLPVNVSGREQTVELTPSNAYTRTKSF